MTYRGRVENGVIVLDEPTKLPEGVIVTIGIAEAADEDQRPLSPLLKLAGKAVGLPSDASANLDHYLYSHPKRD